MRDGVEGWCGGMVNSTTHIALITIIGCGLLDAIGYQAHGGCSPQEKGKPSHQVFEELQELWKLPGWGDRVGTIPPLPEVNLVLSKALHTKGDH